MDSIVWAAILLGAGLLLVGLEFLIPSSGILGVLSGFAVLAGIALAFIYGGAAWGFSFIVIAVLSIPGILILGFQWLPYTPFGKKLLVEIPTSEEVLSDTATRRNMRSLIGVIGKSVTPILPSGSIEVEGRILDAVSQGMPIEANMPVQIIDIQGTRIIVRPYDGQFEAPRPITPAGQIGGGNILEQSLETLGIEGWDQPLK